MFIGHFAFGLAAKKIAPRASLGTLMLSVSFVDVLWPYFLLLGWEHVRINPGDTAVTPLEFYHYPYSHSLLAVLGWSLLFSTAYYLKTKYGREALVLGADVFSHWLLDFFSHRADMPLWPTMDSAKFGLGLWNSITATIIIEVSLFIASIVVYTRVTRAQDRVGKWGFYAFMALLIIIYFSNIFGPPPPSEKAIAYFGAFTLALFIIPYWIDNHRTLAK